MSENYCMNCKGITENYVWCKLCFEKEESKWHSIAGKAHDEIEKLQDLLKQKDEKIKELTVDYGVLRVQNELYNKDWKNKEKQIQTLKSQLALAVEALELIVNDGSTFYTDVAKAALDKIRGAK